MGDSRSLEVGGREVVVSNPDKVIFPEPGVTKLDLVNYYLAVADGALRGVARRPMILKRFVKGIAQEAIFQKRAPEKRPDWIDVAELKYASGTSAKEAVIDEAAGLVWAVSLGCIDFNPHPVRADDLEHPDELRVDLDPMPGVEWPQIVDVAIVVRDVLTDYGLTAWPKTSGSRGFHIYARIERNWPYKQVRLAAQTVAREVERRAPELATSRWWKEERQGVFVDFNQNAKDRTVASAYSVRSRPDARVSTPLFWDEVPGCRPEEFTVATVPARYARFGDPWAGMDDAAGGLEGLLALAEELGPMPKAEKPGGGASADGRRASQMPLIEIARTKTRDEAMAALDEWRSKHPEAASALEAIDVLVDGMRGPSSIWYRIRINLQHVPEELRPPQEPLIADYSPWVGYQGHQGRRP
ncbi:non-homologous end-joining DNA ligase [Mycolicibacterium mucogenicum]|jgi:DNA ligase D-like protein (predicted polymerase)|uniref:non-homologous end-joining DNA ligase n=1 Tax=Mycolicibacterium mucogenicum TaxID=56689 RepID=UPI0011D37AD4|nr:non-homologous end-joining DNA ligase [Mycolicibacterium mucogenicum]MCX8555790.1 non-homologous end-joining DNA ligase [Mycolicibacterium mucogenicum]TXH24644.1 MAG: DNA polymerase domain-containing protein [Mycobacterium sp.]